MIAFPNAKINLGLNVVKKREDGFHDIESCFYPIPWQDCLEVIKADEFSFHSYGLTIPGDWKSNLCVQAYQLLQEAYHIPPVEIHLLKQIPMGAGLGGGSSDGAWTLKLLNGLFELGLSDESLESLALKLGSDCPFFIRNQAALAKGKGEFLTPIDLNLTGYYLGIKNPGIHISTAEAYAGVLPKLPKQLCEDILNAPVNNWKNLLTNDFEQSVFKNHPEIEAIKGAMYSAGAIYASMTGSGSTVFGIFANKINDDWKWLTL
ncbi:MAG: 4-(cytidine 5'-diphospho)-2-C-methyl-D-erythritol kinase [Bacteroidota bacterium]